MCFSRLPGIELVLRWLQFREISALVLSSGNRFPYLGMPRLLCVWFHAAIITRAGNNRQQFPTPEIGDSNSSPFASLVSICLICCTGACQTFARLRFLVKFALSSLYFEPGFLIVQLGILSRLACISFMSVSMSPS